MDVGVYPSSAIRIAGKADPHRIAVAAMNFQGVAARRSPTNGNTAHQVGVARKGRGLFGLRRSYRDSSYKSNKGFRHWIKG